MLFQMLSPIPPLSPKGRAVSQPPASPAKQFCFEVVSAKGVKGMESLAVLLDHKFFLNIQVSVMSNKYQFLLYFFFFSVRGRVTHALSLAL